MMICRVNSCSAQAHGRGRLCSRHAGNNRRHGDPEQQAITKAALAPYGRLVEALKTRNSGSPIWGQLVGQWADLASDAEDAVKQTGAFHRPTREAEREIIRLGQGVAAWEIVKTALAMAWMMQDQPRLVRSDDAARVQMARRVRGLIEREAGIWTDAKGKQRRAYRDIPRETSIALGQRLMATFGGTGIALQRGEDARAAARRKRQETIEEGLASLE